MNNVKALLDAANHSPDGVDERPRRDALHDLARYLEGVIVADGPNGVRGKLRVRDDESTRIGVSHKLAMHHERLSRPELRNDGSLDYYRNSLERIGGALERGHATLTAVAGELYGVACDAHITRDARPRPARSMGIGPNAGTAVHAPHRPARSAER